MVRVLAEGKEAVLTYLEDQLIGLPAHPGRYSLTLDDHGKLVICIAGNTFIGEGETVQAGMRLTIRGGVVKQLELPQDAEANAAPDTGHKEVFGHTTVAGVAGTSELNRSAALHVLREVIE